MHYTLVAYILYERNLHFFDNQINWNRLLHIHYIWNLNHLNTNNNYLFEIVHNLLNHQYFSKSTYSTGSYLSAKDKFLFKFEKNTNIKIINEKL